MNPVRVDITSSRPGGTARVIDGMVVLPVQDCATTYGGAIRLLRFPVLTPDRVEMAASDRMTVPPAFAPYVEGLHTLAAAGPVTLIDAKRTELSLHGLSIEAIREGKKLVRKLRA
jgi:hypothetical protein